MDSAATGVVEQTNSNTAWVCSARVISNQLSLLQTAVWRCMRFALNAYPYKIHWLQESKPGDNDLREKFAQRFWHRWRWNKIGPGTSYGPMKLWGTLNTHNSRICSTENSARFNKWLWIHHMLLRETASLPHLWLDLFFWVNLSAGTRNLFCNCSPLSRLITRYGHS